jgi:Rrf2 family protein
MNISARCEYACRAVVELARREHAEEPVTAQTIAEHRSIPEKYLVHILLQLKRAGLVRSVRGAQGGYLLAKPADTVTLLDVIEAIDGPILDPLPAQDEAGDDLSVVWRHVATGMSEVLSQWSVRRILDAMTDGSMYYI